MSADGETQDRGAGAASGAHAERLVDRARGGWVVLVVLLAWGIAAATLARASDRAPSPAAAGHRAGSADHLHVSPDAARAEATPGRPGQATTGRGFGDHHLHLRSQAGAELLAGLDPAEAPPGGAAARPRALTAADALAALDAAGLERGLVLSIAYMFAAPGLEIDDARARVRAENDYVAAQVAAHPDRLAGACSVNPLAEYALDEIARCAGDLRLTALKLHFGNSGVDLRDAGHVARLVAVFELLDRNGLPAVVHLRAREEDYGAPDARAFIDQVLARMPGVPVQIAHMAGWGGYDDATDAALGAFAEAFAEGRLDPRLYTFDLGAVVFVPEAAGADTALAERVRAANGKLARRIREIGVERVVLGSDWPSWPPGPDLRGGIAAYLRVIEVVLPLNEDERARILANAGPALRRP